MTSYLDNCDFNATSTGTGDFVVTTAVTGRQTPVNAGAVTGEVYRYYARSSDLSQWEEGFGAYTVAGTTLARTTVVSNSAGTTALINFTTVPLVAIVAGKRDLAALNDLKNVTFAVSASAGALTIALKDAAGNDATPAAPIPILFRNVSLTASPNTPTVLEVQAATSVVVPSTSTCGVTSATGCRLWVTAWNDGGTFRLGVFNASTSSASATNIYSLTEGGIGSSLQVVAAGNAAGQHYTAGAAVTSKAFRILGYVDWNATGMTAGTWTTTNLNSIATFGPGVKKPGDEIQTVMASTQTETSVTSTTYGICLTANITPTNAANLIRSTAHGSAMANAGLGGVGAVALFSGSTELVEQRVFGASATAVATGGSLQFFNLPNTVSSVAYTVKARGDGTNGCRWPSQPNSGVAVGSLTVTEIMG